MSVTLNIPESILAEAGYINLQNAHDLRKVGLVALGELENVRLTINEIARFLGVGDGRIRRFFRYNDIRMDADGKMSLKKVLTFDWSEITDLREPGDGRRKSTHFYNKSI